MSRIILPGLTFLAFFGVSCVIRAQDEFKEIRAREQILVQKLTSQVSDAITLSRKQERTDPISAKYQLQDVLRQVRDTADLTPEVRARLVRQLQARINDVEDFIRERRVTQETKTFRDYERPKSRPSYTPSSSGTSAFAKDFRDGAKTAIDGTRDAIRIRESGFRDSINSAEKTPVYPSDATGIGFPKNWAALTALRKKTVGPQLTPKEVALLKTLNSVMSVNFEGEKFRSVIDYLQDRTGLTVIVDDAAMKEAMVEYDDPVTFKVNKITVRTILKKVLGDKNLTYVIKEGTIQVMTPKQARELMVLRTYPVQDLISPGFQTQMFGPFVAQAQMWNNAQQLIFLIQSVDPSYWQPAGPGSITFFPPTQSLMIRASAEMHYQLGSPGLYGQ